MHASRIVLLIALSACVAGIGARSRQSVVVDGVFSLTRVGGRVLESRAQNQRSCSLRPYWVQMTLRSPSWVDAESLFINCREDGSSSVHVRGASGTYRSRGKDTIDFYATEAGRDSTSPVFSGIIQGTTLRVFGDDEGDGDYVYVKKATSH